MHFDVAQAATDLSCPRAAPRPRPRHAPSAPDAGTSRAPDDDQAGVDPVQFAQAVVRESSRIDPDRIPGFALDAATTASPRRIAIWGDSHVAGGTFVPTLDAVLLERGVTVGTRFLPPTMGRANVRLPTLHAYCIGPAWSSQVAFTSKDAVRVGPALLDRVADAGADSYLWLDFRSAALRPVLRQVGIVYEADAGAALDLAVNDAQARRVVLPAGGVLRVDNGDYLVSTLRMQVAQGHVVLHGFILDYRLAPLVVLDAFGLPSATARGWAEADPDYLAQALHGVDYDAVVLEYGTNEGNDLPFDRAKYEAGLGAALTHLRKVFPRASCVLVGPPDRGVPPRKRGIGDALFFGRVHRQIAAAQADVGARFGCAAWDWQDLMGGPGGSYGWAQATPRLMNADDLTHLTPAGYERSARALARSLGWSVAVPAADAR